MTRDSHSFEENATFDNISLIREKNVFTIAPDLSFLEVLAAGLIFLAGRDKSLLARTTIFLKSSLTCMLFQRSFLKFYGIDESLLPHLIPVDEMEGEIEGENEFQSAAATAVLLPAISGLRRKLLLLNLVLTEIGNCKELMLSSDQGLRLALTLVKLSDEIQCTYPGLNRLSDGFGTAQPISNTYQQIVSIYLNILTTVWPSILAKECCLEPAVRRDLVIKSYLSFWSSQPPKGPVIVAGLAHVLPILQPLLTTIVSLSKNKDNMGSGCFYCVVLPGLDRTLSVQDWITLDATHPQAGFKSLLEFLDIDRLSVADWPLPKWLDIPSRAHPERVHLVTEALRSKSSTRNNSSVFSGKALVGVSIIECSTDREETQAVSFLLRRALEHKKTATLITPDSYLARQVAAELQRQGITIKNSLEKSLAYSLLGTFLRLTAQLVSSNFSALLLLMTLKHPLASAGYCQEQFQELVWSLEIKLLRGLNKSATGFSNLRSALEMRNKQRTLPNNSLEELRTLLANLEEISTPLTNMMHCHSYSREGKSVPFVKLLMAHISFVENLAARENCRNYLWQRDSDKTVANFLADLLQAAEGVHIQPKFYLSILETLLKEHTPSLQQVQHSTCQHHNLTILSPFEECLQYPDLLIVGSLGDNSLWYPFDEDSWIIYSSIRAQLGLPFSENRHVCIPAHTFAQAICSPRVVLTYSQQQKKDQKLLSRLLVRLKTAISLSHLADITVSWSNVQCSNLSPRTPNSVPSVITGRRTLPPAPCPPLAIRPSRFSLSEVETLIRNPYAIYAKRVLRLKALPSLDRNPEIVDYNEFIRLTLKAYLENHKTTSLEDSKCCLADKEKFLLALGYESLIQLTSSADSDKHPFLWARFERMVRWLVTHESQLKKKAIQVILDIRGQLTIIGGRGEREGVDSPTPFIITTKLDHLNLLADNRLVVIGYKVKPTSLHKRRGMAGSAKRRLLLQTAMIHAGAFLGIKPNSTIETLLHYQLTGVGVGGEINLVKRDNTSVLEEVQVLADTLAVAEAFNYHGVAYNACYSLSQHPHDAYQHLARTKEWV